MLGRKGPRPPREPRRPRQRGLTRETTGHLLLSTLHRASDSRISSLKRPGPRRKLVRKIVGDVAGTGRFGYNGHRAA